METGAAVAAIKHRCRPAQMPSGADAVRRRHCGLGALHARLGGLMPIKHSHQASTPRLFGAGTISRGQLPGVVPIAIFAAPGVSVAPGVQLSACRCWRAAAGVQLSACSCPRSILCFAYKLAMDPCVACAARRTKCGQRVRFAHPDEQSEGDS
mmetsp:Transcript_28479/g.84336  ORF Transcript_28479/g.84336 Transcript_28479/m.84336 type:complete len:153 (+) Transcript_28479:590-1048(+)|eukprot:356800-Chlamydomonas_euryale.AAC.2